VNSRNQSYVIYLLLFIAIIAMLVYNFSSQGTSQDALTINQVAADVRSGRVSLRIICASSTMMAQRMNLQSKQMLRWLSSCSTLALNQAISRLTG